MTNNMKKLKEKKREKNEQRKLVGQKIIYALLANEIRHICWGSPSYQREGARSSFYCKDHHLRRQIPHRASVHLLTTHDEDVALYRAWNYDRFGCTCSRNLGLCDLKIYLGAFARVQVIYKTHSSLISLLLSMCVLWADTVSDRSTNLSNIT